MLNNREIYFTTTFATKLTLTKKNLVEAEFSRLLHAAIINKRFCASLLADPVATIDRGYLNEHFRFSPATRAKLGMIKAATLSDFASQLNAAMSEKHAVRKQKVSVR